jgi:hypothetical protein
MQLSATGVLAAAFFQTGCFTATVAQVVKLGTTYLGTAHNLDFFNTWAFQQEGALDTNAMTGDTANSEIGLVATPAHPNNYALKNLNTLTVTFDNPQMHFDGITGGQLRMIPVRRLLDKGIDKISHDKVPFTQKYAEGVLLAQCRAL